jgi:hypothetical protein
VTRRRWWLGDGSNMRELAAKVFECISVKERTLVELVTLIGAERGRIAAALVELQRRGEPVWVRRSSGMAKWGLRKADEVSQ